MGKKVDRIMIPTLVSLAMSVIDQAIGLDQDYD